MSLLNLFGFGKNNDILGLYKLPTGYKVGKLILYTGYPFKDSDTRMKRLGYVVEDHMRVPVYEYPGTIDDFKAECATNPSLYASPFQIDPLCVTRPMEESEIWKEQEKKKKSE